MYTAQADWTDSVEETDRQVHPASLEVGSSATNLDSYTEATISMVRAGTVSCPFDRSASVESYTFVDQTLLEQVTHSMGLLGEFKQHLDTLKAFADDPYGWGGPDEERPNEWARYYAMLALMKAFTINLLPTRIIPSADGGVTITFYAGDRYADIECFNSGEILAMTKRGSERADIWPVRLERISDSLGRIDEFIR